MPTRLPIRSISGSFVLMIGCHIPAHSPGQPMSATRLMVAFGFLSLSQHSFFSLPRVVGKSIPLWQFLTPRPRSPGEPDFLVPLPLFPTAHHRLQTTSLQPTKRSSSLPGIIETPPRVPTMGQVGSSESRFDSGGFGSGYGNGFDSTYYGNEFRSGFGIGFGPRGFSSSNNTSGFGRPPTHDSDSRRRNGITFSQGLSSFDNFDLPMSGRSSLIERVNAATAHCRSSQTSSESTFRFDYGAQVTSIHRQPDTKLKSGFSTDEIDKIVLGMSPS